MGSYQKPNPKYSEFTNIEFFLCMFRLWCKKRKEKKGKNFVFSVSKLGPHHPRPYQKFSRPAKDVITFRGQTFENTLSFHLI